MAPIFALLALGFGAVKMGWIEGAGVRGLVHFVFNFAIPALLVRQLAHIELPDDIEWGVLVAYYGASLVTYALGMSVGRWVFGRPLRDQAIFGMSAAYSNLVMMGIPVVMTAFGPEASLPLLLILSFHSAVFLPLTVALIQWQRVNGVSRLRQVGLGFVDVLKNPIILGIIVGFAANFSGAVPSGALDRTLELLEATAVPSALFAMGASLAGYPLRGDVAPAVALGGLKLVFQPALVWLFAVPVLGLAGPWVAVAVVLGGMPTAVNGYLFGARYEAAPQVAARTVLLTTVASLVTIGVLLALVTGR
jgi:hypothetical protein